MADAGRAEDAVQDAYLGFRTAALEQTLEEPVGQLYPVRRVGLPRLDALRPAPGERPRRGSKIATGRFVSQMPRKGCTSRAATLENRSGASVTARQMQSASAVACGRCSSIWSAC